MSLLSSEQHGNHGGHGSGVSNGSNGSAGSDGTAINFTTACPSCSATYSDKIIKSIHFCDCDDAMDVLATMDNANTTTEPIHYTLSGSSNFSDYGSSFDGLESHKFNFQFSHTSTSSGVTFEDIYKCPMYYTCPILDNFHNITLPGTVTSGGDGWGSSGSGFPDGWYPKPNSDPMTIFGDEALDPTICTGPACEVQNGGDGDDGSDGDDGTEVETPDPGFGQGSNNDGYGGGGGGYVDDPLAPVKSNKTNVLPNLAINPNPVTNLLSVLYSTLTEKQDYVLNVIDIKGQTVLTVTFTSNTGQNTYQLKTDKLAPGSYTLQLTSGLTIQKAVFVKQ